MKTATVNPMAAKRRLRAEDPEYVQLENTRERETPRRLREDPEVMDGLREQRPAHRSSRGTMKQIIFIFFLIGCVAFRASSSEPEEGQQILDLANDQSRSLGVEAIQVGEVLRAISQRIRDALQQPEQAEHEGEEYFIKKLWNKAKNAVKQVGKVVEKTAKGVVTSKAADIVKKFLQDKLGAYALEDDKTYQDFREDLANELDRVGNVLIQKGTQLCSCRGRKHLDEQERKFVQGVVEAL